MSDRNWRVGRKVGRTIYDEDENLIGVMDTIDLANTVVTSVNKTGRTWMSEAERQEDIQRAQGAARGPFIDVLQDLLAFHDEDCRLDHHGLCQSHTLDDPCPVATARRLVHKYAPSATRPVMQAGPGDSPVAASDTAAAGEPAVLMPEDIAAVKAFLDVAERIIPVKLPPPEDDDEEGEGPVVWISAEGLHNLREAQRRGASHYTVQVGLGRRDDYNTEPLYLRRPPALEDDGSCPSEAAGGGHCIFMPGHDVDCKFCYCDDTPCSYWTPKGAA